MTLDRTALRASINDLYRREHEELGDDGTYRMLNAARRWDLSDTMATGGVITFAHVRVADCGVHLAAAVNAALDSGADTVWPSASSMPSPRRWSSPAATCHQGVGPRRHIRRGEYRGRIWISGRGDHGLRSLRHVWGGGDQTKGHHRPPSGGALPLPRRRQAGDLPNVDEVSAMAESAVIVSTGAQGSPRHLRFGTVLAPAPSWAAGDFVEFRRAV